MKKIILLIMLFCLQHANANQYLLSADGNALFYVQRAPTGKILTSYDLESQTYKEIFSSSDYIYSPTLSNSGDFISLIHQGSVVVINVSTLEVIYTMELVAEPVQTSWHIYWADDDARLLIYSSENNVMTDVDIKVPENTIQGQVFNKSLLWFANWNQELKQFQMCLGAKANIVTTDEAKLYALSGFDVVAIQDDCSTNDVHKYYSVLAGEGEDSVTIHNNGQDYIYGYGGGFGFTQFTYNVMKSGDTIGFYSAAAYLSFSLRDNQKIGESYTFF